MVTPTVDARMLRWYRGGAGDNLRRQSYGRKKGTDNAGQGRIFRAGSREIPKGQTRQTVQDIEVRYDNYEPNRPDLDLGTGDLLDDRGDPPRGKHSESSADGCRRPAKVEKKRKEGIVFNHLMEAAGALDLEKTSACS